MDTTAHQVDAASLVSAQRHLRGRLLERGQLKGEDRGIAAEMLLHLDDASTCWSVCASWLVAQTGADRVDGGFSSASEREYTPLVEIKRTDSVLGSVLGTAFDTSEEAIQILWRTSHAVVYHDVQEDRRISKPLRTGLLAAGTRSKIAVAVRDRGLDVGLLCVDSRRAFAWSADQCERLDRIARDVIGPVLGAARELADAAGKPPPTVRSPVPNGGLTAAELRVARLVLAGCSYKEIAIKLDRSWSTIDHQLRSMRQKLGVNSTAKLMRELTRVVSPQAIEFA